MRCANKGGARKEDGAYLLGAAPARNELPNALHLHGLRALPAAEEDDEEGGLKREAERVVRRLLHRPLRLHLVTEEDDGARDELLAVPVEGPAHARRHGVAGAAQAEEGGRLVVQPHSAALVVLDLRRQALVRLPASRTALEDAEQAALLLVRRRH